MAGAVIRYESYSSSNCRQLISGFSFEGKPWATVQEAPNQVRVLCICGADNWTDNGRTMNEYECACCGEYILTEPKN